LLDNDLRYILSCVVNLINGGILMKKLLIIMTLALVLFGCGLSDNSNKSDLPKDFNRLDVDSDFNWSNTRMINVTIIGNATDLEGRRVRLMNGDTVISSAIIHSGQYDFILTVPGEMNSLNVVCDDLNFSQTITPGNQTVVITGTPNVKGNRLDSDGDGVDDADDDFPGDPDKATLLRIPFDREDYWVFEDLWPDEGDYDFNDLVIREYVELHLNAANDFVGGRAKLWLNAIGANFHNSIFIHFMEASLVGGQIVYNELPDPAFVESIETSLTNIRIDEFAPNTIGAWYDIEWEEFGYQNNGIGPQDFPHSREFNFNFDQTAVQPGNITFEWYISSGYSRGREVHLPTFAPSIAADPAYFDTGDDATNIGTGFYYKTALNHPWVIKVWGRFNNPLEYVQITEAYPLFQDWAESNGSLHPDWYNTYIDEKVFDQYSAK
jgi:LruC domain-containing protein